MFSEVLLPLLIDYHRLNREKYYLKHLIINTFGRILDKIFIIGMKGNISLNEIFIANI